MTSRTAVATIFGWAFGFGLLILALAWVRLRLRDTSAASEGWKTNYWEPVEKYLPQG